jgi:hypothetical protein
MAGLQEGKAESNESNEGNEGNDPLIRPAILQFCHPAIEMR